MGSIRKKAIISSILIYIGAFIGLVNNYFYTAKVPFWFYKAGNIFTPEQYALTKIFTDISQIMFAFGALGVIPVVYKFYPYYKDNLEEKKIDLMTWALLVSLIGFVLVLVSGLYFEPLIVRKFTARSPLLVEYYKWVFPLAAGMLLFSVIESFSWALQRSVVSNFLKETVIRFIIAVLIGLYYFKVISYHGFICLFSLHYLFVFLVLAVYLYRVGHLRFTFRISRVTRKFWKKMVTMQTIIFTGTCIAAVAATIDTLIIASLLGLTVAGIFIFAQFASMLIQIPQRSIQTVSAGVLSRAWKDKDYTEINRVYQRSCINLLLMSLFIFGNMWLNVMPAIDLFKIQNAYSAGMGVIFVLSMARIVDATTGLNQWVISTSTFWRFDFYSSVIMFAFRLPLTYLLIKQYGIIGSAFAELIYVCAINFTRSEFLRRKFNMQPLNLKTVYSLLLAGGAYALSYFAFKEVSGWTGFLLRGATFSIFMITGTIYAQLTPDAPQLIDNFKKRFTKP